MNDLPNTNNAIEGWHNVFNASFHNIYQSNLLLLKFLKEEEEIIRQKYLRILGGEIFEIKNIYKLNRDQLKIKLTLADSFDAQFVLDLTNFLFY